MTATVRPPRVSVLVPLYNTERYIGMCVKSLLDQRDVDVEVVIVDDGSTDDSVASASRAADNRVKIVREEHRGIGATLNTAAAIAQGDFIAFQGADDVSLPSRLARQVAALSGGAGFSHCDMTLVDAHEQPLGYQLARPTEREHVLPLLLRRGTPFNNGSILMRRPVFDGTSFDASLRVGEDTDHVRQIGPRADSAHVSEPLYLYRRHDRNSTRHFTREDDWAPLPRLLESAPALLAPEVDRAYGERAAPLHAAHAGSWLVRRGHVETGTKWLERAAAQAVDTDQELVISAMVHLLSGEAAEALAKFRSAQTTSVTLCGAAESALLARRAGEAFQLFREALEADPHNVDALRGVRSTGAAGGIILVDDALTRLR